MHNGGGICTITTFYAEEICGFLEFFGGCMQRLKEVLVGGGFFLFVSIDRNRGSGVCFYW